MCLAMVLSFVNFWPSKIIPGQFQSCSEELSAGSPGRRVPAEYNLRFESIDTATEKVLTTTSLKNA